MSGLRLVPCEQRLVVLLQQVAKNIPEWRYSQLALVWISLDQQLLLLHKLGFGFVSSAAGVTSQQL